MRKERKKGSMFKRSLALLLSAALLAGLSAGCGDGVRTERNEGSLSYEDAEAEMDSMLKKVRVNEVTNPVLDIYSDEVSEADTLADISTFPVTVTGNGDINLEIAAATELSAEAPDDWINIVAQEFNKAGYTIGDKRVTVSVRRITSGEVVTYMTAGDYEPQIFIPSNEAWGMMLKLMKS